MPHATKSQGVLDLESTPVSAEYVRDLEKKVHQLEDTEKAILNVLDDARILEGQLRDQADELKKFRMAAEGSFDHMVITDPDGTVLYANPAVEHITGFSIDEILGKTPALWGGQMGIDFYKNFWKTIKEQKKRFSGEVTNRRKSGEQYIAEIGVSPLLDEQGDVRFFVGVERDITKRRQYEKQLVAQSEDLKVANESLGREKEERDSVLRFLQSIGDGVIAVDLGGNILFLNEAAGSILGIPEYDVKSQSVLGNRCQDFFSLATEKRPNVPIDFLEQIITKKSSLEDTRGLLVRKGLETLPISYSINPIHSDDNRLLGCMIVFKDMTEERAMDNAKDRFLSVAAHQLRTPLSGMRWNMEMLLGGDVGEISPEATETVKKIHANTLRMIGLINDLLNVALLDAGQDPESSEAVGVVETISTVLGELQSLAEKSGVHIDFAPSKKSNSWKVLSFPRRLHEVCENLIHNAVKYSPSGSTVTIHLDTTTEDKIVFSVSDTGIGIPKSEREKIFGKFFRASNALRWKTEGSGLGLAVVKNFVEEMGGRVSFESKEGKGTTFLVELPLAKK
ncbi:MAG: PAS domain-containing protein [Candidatus Moraniibacteriota bacterium]|nr:MAG: PAS domain-containing protein [Candidatus Moranbacteria bacterium]